MKITEYSREKAQEATETAREQSKRLIPWLPDPHRCECGSLCNADNQYVAEQAFYMDVWVCPRDDCGKRYYRDEKDVL